MNQEQQNKPTLMVVAIIVALLIGSAFFFMKRPSTSTKTDSSTGSMMNKDEDSDNDNDTSMMPNGKNTLMGLMGMSKSLQCDFDYTTEGKAGSKGKIYISGKKVRGEFENEVDGKPTMMSMMQDENYTYVWGTVMPEGIKIAVPKDSKTPQQNQYFDPNQPMNVNCKTWGVDQSKFVVPSDVTFRDMSFMMQQPTTSAAAKQGQCAACAQLEGDAKSICEKQLGC